MNTGTMSFYRSMIFFSILILSGCLELPFFSDTEEDSFFEKRTLRSEGTVQEIYILKSSDQGILIRTDAASNGVFDDTTWVRLNRDDPDDMAFLYSERLPEGPQFAGPHRIWFGPGNLVFTALIDFSGRGWYDTMIYFRKEQDQNLFMISPDGTTILSDQRIFSENSVARIEIADRYGVYLWFYPESRLEVDFSRDGSPDHFLSALQLDFAEIKAYLYDAERLQTIESFRPLNRADTFLDLQNLPERNRALVMQSIFP